MKNLTRILLIDDEPEFRFLIKTDLENEGFEVLEAADGFAGIKLALSENPDLILLDLNMPEPDGHQVFRMIRDHDLLRDIPVIILTTGDDINDRLRQTTEVADDHIAKSLDPKERIARIRSILARNR
jgi:DNA-binding response OmpR family regulator